MESYIKKYEQKIDKLRQDCLNINSDDDFKELFKGVVILLIKDIVLLFNKLVSQHPELKFSKSSEKISNLNILLDSLEGDGMLFGINCNDIIMRSYVNFVYSKYRDVMVEWKIENIKNIDEDKIKSDINEKVDIGEYLNIIPEIKMMANYLKEKEILKILFLLNNLNVIIDIYLLKHNK
jgi:hypothetical protein